MSPNDTPGSAADIEQPGHHIRHLRAADVIGDRTQIYAIRPEDTIETAAVKLKDWRVRTIAVTDDVGNVSGVFGQSDIASRVVAAGLDPRHVPVRDVMTGDPVCVDVETDLLTIVRVMQQHGISHVVLTRPTPEGEQYFGMISANDVLRVIASGGSAGREMVSEFASGSA